MNQVNSTDAVILKSSCSCGRFLRIADIKNVKRPQISPWVLLDESRRCGRYGHITRICCIGGNTYVFSHMCIRIGKRPQRPHVRKSVLREHEQLVLTMWAVGVGGDAAGRASTQRRTNRSSIETQSSPSCDHSTDKICKESIRLKQLRAPKSHRHIDVAQTQTNNTMRYRLASGVLASLPLWRVRRIKDACRMGPPAQERPSMG